MSSSCPSTPVRQEFKLCSQHPVAVSGLCVEKFPWPHAGISFYDVISLEHHPLPPSRYLIFVFKTVVRERWNYCTNLAFNELFKQLKRIPSACFWIESAWPAILEAVMRLQFQPMPLQKRRVPFDHPDWIYELKM